MFYIRINFTILLPLLFYFFIGVVSARQGRQKLFSGNATIRHGPAIIAVCTIIKNEALYIKEWIVFHKLLGFNKFIIYDDNSNDDIRHVLDPYINTGIVDFLTIPELERFNVNTANHMQVKQTWAFSQCSARLWQITAPVWMGLFGKCVFF